jgi:hypothetical protein
MSSRDYFLIGMFSGQMVMILSILIADWIFRKG